VPDLYRGAKTFTHVSTGFAIRRSHLLAPGRHRPRRTARNGAYCHEHQGRIQERRVRTVEDVEDAKPGEIYTAFSEEELRDIRKTLGWLKAAEQSFEFWNNPSDAIYDTP
jgi:hypothetical protein